MFPDDIKAGVSADLFDDCGGRVFCHAENQFWELSELDEEKIESPKVPSGMTGGVEYEAMGYCVSKNKCDFDVLCSWKLLSSHVGRCDETDQRDDQDGTEQAREDSNPYSSF